MNWISVGSGNALSPVRRQAITCTNANLWSIGPLGTNVSEIRIEIQNFSFLKTENAFGNVVCQIGGHVLQGEMS